MVSVNVIAYTITLLGSIGGSCCDITHAEGRIESLLVAKGLSEECLHRGCFYEKKIWIEPEVFELDAKVYQRVFKRGGKRIYKSHEDEVVVFLSRKDGQFDELVRDELLGYVSATINVGVDVKTLANNLQISNDLNRMIIETQGCVRIIENGISVCIRCHPGMRMHKNLTAIANAIFNAGLEEAKKKDGTAE